MDYCSIFVCVLGRDVCPEEVASAGNDVSKSLPAIQDAEALEPKCRLMNKKW
jgi:hypothetical protein